VGNALQYRGDCGLLDLALSHISPVARYQGMVFLVPHVCLYNLAHGCYTRNKQGNLTMRKASFHILRVGLAITFIWIGILILTIS